jgi:hypothetical protein
MWVKEECQCQIIEKNPLSPSLTRKVEGSLWGQMVWLSALTLDPHTTQVKDPKLRTVREVRYD